MRERIDKLLLLLKAQGVDLGPAVAHLDDPGAAVLGEIAALVRHPQQLPEAHQHDIDGAGRELLLEESRLEGVERRMGEIGQTLGSPERQDIALDRLPIPYT